MIPIIRFLAVIILLNCLLTVSVQSKRVKWSLSKPQVKLQNEKILINLNGNLFKVFSLNFLVSTLLTKNYICKFSEVT